MSEGSKDLCYLADEKLRLREVKGLPQGQQIDTLLIKVRLSRGVGRAYPQPQPLSICTSILILLPVFTESFLYVQYRAGYLHSFLSLTIS